MFHFATVQNLFFHDKNSIQRMKGHGLLVFNCDNVMITNCSYYHSAVCTAARYFPHHHHGSGVVIKYFRSTHHGYTLELSHSNVTKCCNSLGGGLNLQTQSKFGLVRVLFNHLIVSENKASRGGGLAAVLKGNGNVTLVISKCLFTNGSASVSTGGMFFVVSVQSNITIHNTKLLENAGHRVSELIFFISTGNPVVSLLNSTIVHTKSHSGIGGVYFRGRGYHVNLINTRMTFANQHSCGLSISGITSTTYIKMDQCQFEGSHHVPIVLNLFQTHAAITNCTFSNNTDGLTVIAIRHCAYQNILMNSSIISDNKMTGITLLETVASFVGHNLIQNNINKAGAGITLLYNAFIEIEGKLLLYNNTAEKHGGAIYAKQPSLILPGSNTRCTFLFNDDFSLVLLSGNKAKEGGSDMYGATLMGCQKQYLYVVYVPHIGHHRQPSWYFDTALMKQIRLNNTDRISSMSSDPIMVCFCNNSNLPNCSDRTQHHVQTYPGLVLSTTIATVGYYGGTSPGNVQVSVQHATVVRYYGQIETTECFQVHILLQNTSSTTALIDIKVNGGLKDWGLSIEVDITECPIGFTQNKISGKCSCEQFLDNRNVQCNVSDTSYRFLRSGNGWFAYSSHSQCITGTTSCPFDYCNRSDVSFDIMAPDRQCVGNRAGTLCGKCQSHLSIMLGSNRCGTCSNWYLLSLPLFAIAGIVLVAVLMFLNLSVSVGTINGLLFYANIMKLNEGFFFPNGNVPFMSQFISWLNLDLGIEVCLFNGLDGYLNTWLQFAFPAYLFLLMGSIIVGCRYFIWLCRLCGSHAVPALATLFLMSYTKILLTVVNRALDEEEKKPDPKV